MTKLLFITVLVFAVLAVTLGGRRSRDKHETDDQHEDKKEEQHNARDTRIRNRQMKHMVNVQDKVKQFEKMVMAKYDRIIKTLPDGQEKKNYESLRDSISKAYMHFEAAETKRRGKMTSPQPAGTDTTRQSDTSTVSPVSTVKINTDTQAPTTNIPPTDTQAPTTNNNPPKNEQVPTTKNP